MLRRQPEDKLKSVKMVVWWSGCMLSNKWKISIMADFDYKTYFKTSWSFSMGVAIWVKTSPKTIYTTGYGQYRLVWNWCHPLNFWWPPLNLLKSAYSLNPCAVLWHVIKKNRHFLRSFSRLWEFFGVLRFEWQSEISSLYKILTVFTNHLFFFVHTIA